MPTFNILGSCILRDIFRIVPDKNYKINQFIQFNSPISFMEEQPRQSRVELEQLQFENYSTFRKRCICIDFNKTTRDIIANNLSDYFLIDLSELRFPISRVTLETGESFLVTHSGLLDAVEKQINHINFQLKNARIQHNIEFSEEQVFDVLMQYCDFIKTIYCEKYVIVVENYLQYRHIDCDGDGFFEYYQASIFKVNQRLKKYYNFLRKTLKDANFIKMPKYCLGSVQHIFNADPLHFQDQYYQYLFQAIDEIVHPCQTKKEALLSLYSDYFKLVESQKRMEYFIKSLPDTNLLINPNLSAEHGCPNGWMLLLSKTSYYDQQNHLLSCGDETNPWAILCQEIDIKKFSGKTCCFSVKYQTFNESVLNIVLRYKDPDGKWILHTAKQCFCDLYENIDSIISVIPSHLPETVGQVCVYLSKPKHSATIIQTKLELGHIPSLF